MIFVNTGISFTLPNGTQYVSLVYGAFTANASIIIINGESANPPVSFAELSGTTLGGVSIETEPIGLGTNPGKLILNGPLDSLTVGGVEFALNDVTIGIPEPATATLMLAGMVVFLFGRRRG